jgi:nucleoside-diphosphate-sugar epimerase
MKMNIFIAGGSGAIGRVLVPMLMAEGHRVVALTRNEDGAKKLAAMGAAPVIGDVFDAAKLTRLVQLAKPEIVIHQLTAFGPDSAGLEATIRIRIEGTRNLVAAAEAAGAKRILTQSISFICTPYGKGLTDESTPLYLDAPPSIQALAFAVSELERQTLESTMESVVLRYGWFYGLGTNYDPNGSIPTAIRKGRMSIVGRGKGTYSFVDLRDAALATMIAIGKGSGIYNIVDDHPVQVSEWLPIIARILNAPSPGHFDEAIARAKLGDLFVYTMNEQRGASNAKAKRELGWTPQTPSWKEGMAQLYSSSDGGP